MTAELIVTGLLQPFTTAIWRVEAGHAGLAMPKSTYPGVADRQLAPVWARIGTEMGGWPVPFTVAVPWNVPGEGGAENCTSKVKYSPGAMLSPITLPAGRLKTFPPVSVRLSCWRTQVSAPELSTLAPRSDCAPGTTVPKSMAEGLTWRLQGAELDAVLCSCTFTVPPASEVTICSCSTTSPEVVGTKLTGMDTEAPVVSVTG